MNDIARPTQALAAVFDSMDALIAAAKWLREHGYKNIELYSPYPPEQADQVLGLKRPHVPLFVLAGGLIGAAGGMAAQWFTNAWDYPINVGGRPLNAVPAWVPITFELGVLLASFAAVISLMIGCGLPRLWHPLFEHAAFTRVSTDQYWLSIDARDSKLDPARTHDELLALGALQVHALVEAE